MKFTQLTEVFDENYGGFFVKFMKDAKKWNNGSKVPVYKYTLSTLMSLELTWLRCTSKE